MAELREITSEQLKKILEEHGKWVESKRNKGKWADLADANLQDADLAGANLQGAILVGAVGLTVFQVKEAKSWGLAHYSDDFLKELGLLPDHNESVKKKLAELAKKAAGTKK